jgi:hypothetical protein
MKVLMFCSSMAYRDFVKELSVAGCVPMRAGRPLRGTQQWLTAAAWGQVVRVSTTTMSTFHCSAGMLQLLDPIVAHLMSGR